MSDLSAFIAALDTAARAAITLPSGTAGVESDIRQFDDLSSNELPHVFIFNVQKKINVLDFLQIEKTMTATIHIVTAADTHTQILAKAEALEDQINSDGTLAGIVTFAYAESTTVFQHPDIKTKVAELVVTAQRVD